MLEEKRRNEMAYFISSRLIFLLACGQNNVEGDGGGGEGFASLRSQTDSVSHDKKRKKGRLVDTTVKISDILNRSTLSQSSFKKHWDSPSLLWNLRDSNTETESFSELSSCGELSSNPWLLRLRHWRSYSAWLPMPKLQQSWVRSKHPQWNLRDDRCSSVE